MEFTFQLHAATKMIWLISHFNSRMVYSSPVSLYGCFVSGCRLVLRLTSPLSCSFNTTLKISSESFLFVLYSTQSSNSWVFCSLSADLWQQSERKWSRTGALGRRERGNGGRSYLPDCSDSKPPGWRTGSGRSWVLPHTTCRAQIASVGFSCAFVMHDMDWKLMWDSVLRKHTFVR